jgi:site-specific DNA recombinase
MQTSYKPSMKPLRSSSASKVPARPLSASRIQEMLRNPYYVGIVIYRDRRATGRHETLIDRDTFDRVQALLSARSVAGDRPHEHQHYLRGTLYCAECGGRLLYGKYRGNGGQYEYFCRIGRLSRRQGGRCQSRHYAVHQVEDAIIEHYRTVQVTKRVRNTISGQAQRLLEAAELHAPRHRDITRRSSGKDQDAPRDIPRQHSPGATPAQPDVLQAHGTRARSRAPS